MSRYYAAQVNARVELHGWDESTAQAHKQKDFSRGHFVHVMDSHTDTCVACGVTSMYLQATKAFTCPGPSVNSVGIIRAPVAGGIVGSSSAQESLKDMIEKYKITGSTPTGVIPDDCHTEPEKEKLIAESAKPTTGVDWDAFKNFGKGL